MCSSKIDNQHVTVFCFQEIQRCTFFDKNSKQVMILQSKIFYCS